jgi:hypothetical protein
VKNTKNSQFPCHSHLQNHPPLHPRLILQNSLALIGPQRRIEGEGKEIPVEIWCKPRKREAIAQIQEIAKEVDKKKCVFLTNSDAYK